MTAFRTGVSSFVPTVDLDRAAEFGTILRDNWGGRHRAFGISDAEWQGKVKVWLSRSSENRLVYVIGDREMHLGANDTDARKQLALAVACWSRPVLDSVIAEARRMLAPFPPGQVIIEVGNSADETGPETPFSWNPLMLDTGVADSTIRKRWTSWGNLVRASFPGYEIWNRTATTRTSHVYRYSDDGVTRTWSGKVSPIVTEAGVTGSKIHDWREWVSLYAFLLRHRATVIIIHSPYLEEPGKARAIFTDPMGWYAAQHTLDGANAMLARERRSWPSDLGGFCEPTVMDAWRAVTQ